MSTPTDGPAHGPEPHLENPGVRFERRDANLRLIVITAGLLVAVTAAALLAMWGMMGYYHVREAKTHRDGNPLAVEDAGRQLDQRLKDIPAPALEGLQPIKATDLRPTSYPQ